MLEKIKEKFSDILFSLGSYIQRYIDNASWENKFCTSILVIIAFVFLALNIWQAEKEKELTNQMQHVVDASVEPLVEELNEIKMYDYTYDISENIDSIIDFINEFENKTVILYGMCIAIFLGCITDVFKEPFNIIIGLVRDCLETEKDDEYIHVPIIILTGIDIAEILLLFF